MKEKRLDLTGRRPYASPCLEVYSLGTAFPVCLQTSNGAQTENYEEQDIWEM
jgi:hypothetical protein